MFRSLLLVVCAVRADFWNMGDTPRNSQKGWLENLKRRLMIDNYDYQPSSDEFELRANDKNPVEAPMETTGTIIVSPTDDLLEDPQDKIEEIQFVYDSPPEKHIDQNVDTFDDLIHSIYMPSNRVDEAVTPSVPQNSIEEHDDVDGISRNDVHVYMRESEKVVPETPVSPTRNVSYKVIQPSLISRRVGDAAPRFVQEVGADGVSLLSVDGAPFPEFQLPSARRQYQAVGDSISEDWID